jgi:ribose transport system ATP-binding protein/inositol transport system ATP-binding protein
VKALDGVSLSIKKGEVHAVVGENGAGKSTIMKILGGLYFADGGDIYIDGTRRNINSVAAALKNGISVVYQELHLMPDLTVAENIFLHGLPSRAGMVDKKALNRRAQALLDDMNVSIKATDQISLLSVSQQQMVEIAKALSHDAEIIIMDEPTAALNVSEVEALYGVIRRLRENGKTVIYISHRLKEIFDVTDRVSVLRDGRYIGTRATGDIGQDELVAMMVGRELSQFYTTSDHAYGEPVLEVRGLSRDGLFSDISFTLHKGELLGVAGLMGCRKEEIFQSLYGLYAPDAGEIALNGRTVFSAAQGVNLISSPRKAMGIGIGYVTEDRKGSGVFALMTCRENLTISVLRQLSGAGIIRGQSEDDLLDGYTRKMNMKYSGHRQRMNSLSGGNQQKFLLARTLAANCSVLIMLEPTRGIDVGAKAEIYSLLEELAREGLSVIIVSSELSEIIGNCHRALVIFQGGLTGVIEKGEFDETLIMQYATGNLTKLGAGRRAG